MRKINEIFYSLQGEGHHTGYPSVFIRFAGCNLKCPFCDTNHEEGIFMDDDAIVHAVELNTSPRKKIAIETNGTCPLPPGIDWVTVSPKERICEDTDPDSKRAKVVVDHADEIKVVDVGQDLEPYFSLGCRGEKTLMYLQPCYVEDAAQREANRLRTVRRVLADPRWTLSVQLHRFLGIP